MLRKTENVTGAFLELIKQHDIMNTDMSSLYYYTGYAPGVIESGTCCKSTPRI